MKTFFFTMALLMSPAAFSGSFFSASDVETTRKIRVAVMKQDLSIAAKNIIIVTVNGQVRLTGEVASAKEKELIQKIAGEIAGQKKVKNELAIH